MGYAYHGSHKASIDTTRFPPSIDTKSPTLQAFAAAFSQRASAQAVYPHTTPP